MFELHFELPVSLHAVQEQIIKMLTSKKFKLLGTYVDLRVTPR
jgi:hypothetical protein